MVGIDVDIERARLHFENNLWTDKNCEFYGRVYPNEKADGIIPEVHITGTDKYKEVLLDRNLDCIAFFYVDPNRGLSFADVSIIFAVNVKNIYSSYSTRETERAMRDAKLELSRAGVAFDIEETAGVITGIDAVEEFTFTNQNKMDMHPFYLFRFECEANYDFNTPCDYQTDQFVLTMSSDDETQGLTLPAIGAHTYIDGTNVTVYPVPKTGYEWLKWQLNGVDSPIENPTITMDGNETARAFFQAILQIKQELFSDIPEIYGNHYIFKNALNGTKQKNINLIFGIDSLTVSGTCDATSNYPETTINKLKLLDKYRYTWYNEGYGGETMVEWDTAFSSRIPQTVVEGARNILVIFGFANTKTATAQDKIDAMKSITNKCHALGVEVLGMTAVGSATPAVQTEIQAANDLLKADNSFLDYYLDLSAIPELYELVIPTTSCDGVHLQPSAKEILATAVSDYIKNNIANDYDTDGDVLIKNQKVWKTNGINERATMAANSSIEFGTGDFSLWARVKIPAGGAGGRVISKRTNDTGNYFDFQFNDTYLGIATKSFNTSITLRGEGFYENTIVDVGVVREGTQTKFYCQGSKFGEVTQAFADDVTNPNAEFNISAFKTFDHDEFTYYGVKMFDRALTDVEFSKLRLDLPISLNNCVMDLDFGIGKGDIINDRSSFQNNLTINSLDDDATWITDDSMPLGYFEGCTVFQNDSDSEYAIVSYNHAGAPNESTKTGYTKTGDFPAGSGILKGLSNTYQGIQYLDWELIAKTFAEIYAEPNSGLYIKEGDADNITKLTIKQ
jgi:hypothetical protein